MLADRVRMGVRRDRKSGILYDPEFRDLNNWVFVESSAGMYINYEASYILFEENYLEFLVEGANNDTGGAFLFYLNGIDVTPYSKCIFTLTAKPSMVGYQPELEVGFTNSKIEKYSEIIYIFDTWDNFYTHYERGENMIDDLYSIKTEITVDLSQATGLYNMILGRGSVEVKIYDIEFIE